MLNKKSLLVITLTSVLFVGCSQEVEETTTVEPSPVVVNSDVVQSDEQAVVGSNNTKDYDRGDSDNQAYATEYDIDMINFEYSLTELQAKPGDTITINLTNSEGNHDLVIDELDVHSEHLEEGQTETMSFVIPEDIKPGTEYEFYCSVGNHRQQGMVGRITIIE